MSALISDSLETLDNENLVESLANQYHITIAGKYRLQQLMERQEYESRTTDLLNKINQKLDQERDERISAAEQDRKQKRIEHIQFWATFIAALIGSAAAVGGLIATIVLN